MWMYIGINPRCGLAKKLSDSFFHQIGCSEIWEEVLEEILQEDLPDEDELPIDIQEELPGEEETHTRYDSEDIEDIVQSAPAKRVRFQVSDDEDEQDHPSKRVRLQARGGIKKQAARMVARSSQSLKIISPGDIVAVPI